MSSLLAQVQRGRCQKAHTRLCREDEIKAIMALAGDLFVHVMAYEVGTKLILIYRRYGVYS